MGSFRDKALAEGVDLGSSSTNGLDSAVVGDETAKKDVVAESSPVETPAKETSPDGGAKPVSSHEDNLPFHKHPRWAKMQRELEESRENAKQMSDQYRQLLERAAFLNPNANQQTVDPNSSAALRQLFQMAKSDPEVSKMLGLDSIESTRKELEAIKQATVQSSFNSEFGSVVDECVSRFGLTKEEFEGEFDAFLEENELIKSYTPGKGVLKKLANAMLFDRQEELVERKLNARLLKEKSDKKSLNSESPAKNAQTPSKAGGSPRSRLESLVAEGGGVGF